METKSYEIKNGYRANDAAGNVTLDGDGRVFWTAARIKNAARYQWSVYERAAEYARAGHATSVVDVGCGPGTKLMTIVAPEVSRVVGIDQESAIAVCKRDHPAGEWYVEDLEKPSQRLRGEMDVVICADVIEHLVDPDALLAYLRSLAKPAARLFISTPERDLLRGEACMTCDKGEHVREWNTPELIRYLTKNGLIVEHHYTLADQRPTMSRGFVKHLAARARRGHLFTCQLAVCRLAS